MKMVKYVYNGHLIPDGAVYLRTEIDEFGTARHLYEVPVPNEQVEGHVDDLENNDEIKMHFVNSTNISHIGYSEDDMLLKVRFQSGAEYEYYEVPKKIFENMLTATSVGVYFNSFVKHKYGYEKVSE